VRVNSPAARRIYNGVIEKLNRWRRSSHLIATTGWFVCSTRGGDRTAHQTRSEKLLKYNTVVVAAIDGYIHIILYWFIDILSFLCTTLSSVAQRCASDGNVRCGSRPCGGRSGLARYRGKWRAPAQYDGGVCVKTHRRWWIMYERRRKCTPRCEPITPQENSISHHYYYY